MVLLDRFFSFGEQKKWLLVALASWLSYTVMIVWELARADLVLVVLTGLNRFDCNAKFYCLD